VLVETTAYLSWHIFWDTMYEYAISLYYPHAPVCSSIMHLH